MNIKLDQVFKIKAIQPMRKMNQQNKISTSILFQLKIFPFLMAITTILFWQSCSTQKATDIPSEINAIENGLIKPIVVKGDSIPTFSIRERMEEHHVPGASIAIVRDGKIRWAKGYGIANTQSGSQVDTNTLFQAGSISKPIAALAALKLVEEGKVDLDVDVNSYLNDWKIPENEFTRLEKVTLRRLMTHSAGTTVHGFPGYSQTDSFPSIIDVLNGEGNTPKIVVDTTPGSIFRYSGGGYTIMEKLVEDVSGMSLDEYLAQNILAPLGMVNSTYQQPLPPEYHSQASAAYRSDGSLIEGYWHNYPEQAAAGLWTTPSDLAKYCIAIQNILDGTVSGPLSQEMVREMLTKHKNDWGLGPSLAGERDRLRFQHGGKNEGFTNNMIAFAHPGDAVIVMTNADNGGKLIGEILRSVSKYYDWGINEPREVETKKLPDEILDRFAGKYIYEEQVPDIGDYLIDVKNENGKLRVFDPNNDDLDIMTPLDSLSFINLEDGDEIKIQLSGDTIGILWNDYFQFYKMAE